MRDITSTPTKRGSSQQSNNNRNTYNPLPTLPYPLPWNYVFVLNSITTAFYFWEDFWVIMACVGLRLNRNSIFVSLILLDFYFSDSTFGSWLLLTSIWLWWVFQELHECSWVFWMCPQTQQCMISNKYTLSQSWNEYVPEMLQQLNVYQPSLPNPSP